MITTREIVYTLRQLSGQLCTPPHLSKRAVEHVQEEGLAKFYEWPSGHWQVTDNGRVFISENTEPSDD